MNNHGMVFPPPQNQKEDKNPSGSYHNHLHPFFWGHWGVSTSNVPSYEWSSWQVRTRRAASVRMFDHTRERVRFAANARHYSQLTSFFLDEKGLVRSFPAILVWFCLEKKWFLGLLIFFNKLVNVSLSLMVYFFRRKRCWSSFKCIPYHQENPILRAKFIFFFISGNKVDREEQLLKISSWSDHHTIL